MLIIMKRDFLKINNLISNVMPATLFENAVLASVINASCFITAVCCLSHKHVFYVNKIKTFYLVIEFRLNSPSVMFNY